MKSYRELDIYNDSKKFAIDVHKMTLTLPKFELYEEGGQVRRSSIGNVNDRRGIWKKTI